MSLIRKWHQATKCTGYMYSECARLRDVLYSSTAQGATIAPPLHDVLPVMDIAVTLPANAHDVLFLRAPAVGIPFKVVRL